MRKLAIFDLDGTLIDSRGLIHEAMLHAHDRCGMSDPGYDSIRRVIGLGLRQAFVALHPDAPDHVLTQMEAAYVEAFVILRETDTGREPMYAGALDLLSELRADGWLLGVATGKTRRGVVNIFRKHGLEEVFHASACTDDGPGKPDPFMVLHNLKLAGGEAANAVVIGDSEHDMKMARGAGVRALGVSWGFGAAAELNEAGAHELHHAFDTLTVSLKRFAAGQKA
jgi:phosphoglycolate phosphatase